MNYELKEDESDVLSADTISQSSTKPDEFWTFAVSRINSENGVEIQKKNIPDCSKKDIDTAIKKAINGIMEKDVLEYISLDQRNRMWPKGKAPKTLDTRMVLAAKKNGDIKARLVAKGLPQRPGEKYFQNF